MSLLSLNDSYSSPLKPDDENDVIFELPSLDFMKTNDQTEGFLNYITSVGNTKFNDSVDKMTNDKTGVRKFLYNAIGASNGSVLESLLKMEDKASKTDIAETFFAMKTLENINLEIKQIEEEIEKYNEIKESLTKAINEHIPQTDSVP